MFSNGIEFYEVVDYEGMDVESGEESIEDDEGKSKGRISLRKLRIYGKLV